MVLNHDLWSCQPPHRIPSMSTAIDFDRSASPHGPPPISTPSEPSTRPGWIWGLPCHSPAPVDPPSSTCWWDWRHSISVQLQWPPPSQLPKWRNSLRNPPARCKWINSLRRCRTSPGCCLWIPWIPILGLEATSCQSGRIPSTPHTEPNAPHRWSQRCDLPPQWHERGATSSIEPLGHHPPRWALPVSRGSLRNQNPMARPRNGATGPQTWNVAPVLRKSRLSFPPRCAKKILLTAVPWPPRDDKVRSRRPGGHLQGQRNLLRSRARKIKIVCV